METWIDGYNVIKRKNLDRGVSLEESRARLLKRLGGRGKVTVWFDSKGSKGSTSESPSHQLDIRYVVGSADEAIVSALRRGDARSITVVTDDLGLAVRCRQLGAGHQDVDAFLEGRPRPSTSASREDSSDKPRPTKSEVEWGLEQFGHLDDDLKGP